MFFQPADQPKAQTLTVKFTFQTLFFIPTVTVGVSRIYFYCFKSLQQPCSGSNITDRKACLVHLFTQFTVDHNDNLI